MWEKDKQLLSMYRTCMANLMTEVSAGEDVDWEDACAVESAKLQQYTSDMIYLYQKKHYQGTTEKRQSYYTPRVPYNQNI